MPRIAIAAALSALILLPVGAAGTDTGSADGAGRTWFGTADGLVGGQWLADDGSVMHLPGDGTFTVVGPRGEEADAGDVQTEGAWILFSSALGFDCAGLSGVYAVEETATTTWGLRVLVDECDGRARVASSLEFSTEPISQDA